MCDEGASSRTHSAFCLHHRAESGSSLHALVQEGSSTTSGECSGILLTRHESALLQQAAVEAVSKEGGSPREQLAAAKGAAIAAQVRRDDHSEALVQPTLTVSITLESSALAGINS